MTGNSILYTDGHTDRHTDRQADSSIAPKSFILLGYNYYILINFHLTNGPAYPVIQLVLFTIDPTDPSIISQLDCYNVSQRSSNSLPNNKILDWTKLKAFANDKLDSAKVMISVYNRVENIVGKGENAGYQHFLLFPQYFQNVSFSRSLIVATV